jgi:beta-phosphoglucomutase-like phosphatase (HAD superfamily)
VSRETELAPFDCDGVLVDSETISNAVLAQVLTAEGLPTTLAEGRRDYPRDAAMLPSEIVAEWSIPPQARAGRGRDGGARQRRRDSRLCGIPGMLPKIRFTLFPAAALLSAGCR